MKLSDIIEKFFLLFLLSSLSGALAAAQFELPTAQPLQQAEPTSWVSSVVFDCGGPCLEGNVAAWQIQIQNTGDKEFSIGEVGLADSDGKIFARQQASQNLAAKAVGTAVLQGLVPPPTRGWTLYYKACFLINNRTECESSDRVMLVMPLAAVECVRNETCRQDERCLAFKCMPFQCQSSETAWNHSCTAATAKQSTGAGLSLDQAALYALLALLLVATAANSYYLLRMRGGRHRG